MNRFRSVALPVLVALTTLACGANPSAPPAPDGSPRGPGETPSSSGGAPGETPAGVDSGAAPVPEGPPALRFVGRFDTSDPEGPRVGWPGARIVARFEGTEVRATLKETSMYKGSSAFDVLVDGAVHGSPLTLTPGVATYTLATGLAPGVHTVELWKRTEGVVGLVQVLGFDFGSGKLLAPPPVANRRVEFLVDSASNGYGIEGQDPSCRFSSATQNERLAYPALVAQALGAEHHDLGYQGRGLIWNYQRAEPDLFPDVYTRTLPLERASAWDFSSWRADVVWITLGGNDYDQPAPGDPAPDQGLFRTKFADLVALVRAKQPTAHVFCALPPSLNDYHPVGYDAYSNVKRALVDVVAAKNSEGDAKVHYVEFTRSDASRGNGAPDLTGCEFHPNTTKHQKMADEAIAAIRAKTGW